MVVDEELVQRVQAIYGLSSKREAIDLALRSLVGRHVQKDMLDLDGAGWDGDLEELRGSRS